MESIAVLPRPVEGGTRRRGRPVFVQKYWAFLSYSHQDEEVANWLQAELESYRVPKRLIGRGTPFGQIPARLSPIFRDRHELAAGRDLREDIAVALSSSRFMLVLCSPAAANSRWVDQEIRLFKQLRPDSEVLAAIVSGEPWASDMPGREAEECLPPALKVEIDAEGLETGERAEPIAADLRESGDGRRAGFLKLVAGMLDVGLDDLIQRESHRRQRRMMAITGASLFGMVVASGLALTAIQARDAARDQRREAEGLIGFMLGDLKDKLEPIGRLDALDAVGARALAYYESQDKGVLSDASLAQRAKALTLIGQIATSRGDLEGAGRRYAEAMVTTAELVRRYPDDSDRLFDHAQNVFWTGDSALKRGQLDEAERYLREYQRLASRMVELDPTSERSRLERQSAETNLGVLLLERDKPKEAAIRFREAVAGSQLLLSSAPGKGEYQQGLSETQAWLADALLRNGDLAGAADVRRRQLAFLRPLANAPRSDTDLRRQESVARQKLGRLLLLQGNVAEAEKNVRESLSITERLLASEPSSAIHFNNAVSQRFDLLDILLLRGATPEMAQLVASSCTMAQRLRDRDPETFRWRIDFPLACLVARARLASAQGNGSEAAEIAAQGTALVASERSANPPVRWQLAFARAASTEAVLRSAALEGDQARARAQDILRDLPAAASDPTRVTARLVATAILRPPTEARVYAAQIRNTGLRDPWLERDERVVAMASRQ